VFFVIFILSNTLSMKKIYFLIIAFLTANTAFPQFQGYKFEFTDSPLLIENGDTLSLPWAGGLNNPQFNTMDVNKDTIKDLVLYDQSIGRMVVFVSDGQKYSYNLDYSETFPADIYGWVLMRDANCDGFEDLYTKAPVGGKIYRYLDGPVNYPVWTIFDDALQYDTNNNIQISEADIPIIEDIDGDGDIDFAVFEFFGGGFIEYYSNLSIELTGGCNISEYEKVEDCWVRIFECPTCGDYEIDLAANCLIGGTSSNYCVFRTPEQHAGSTSLAIDLDGDGDRDLLLGDIGCNEVSYLENIGNNTFAQFDSAELGFPFNTTPINFFEFPALFFEDVDFDGVKDLLVTPNETENFGNLDDMANCVHFYKNNGTNSSPVFDYMQDDLLQEDMLDLGEYSSPALADYDGDGDLDLFIGNRGTLVDTVGAAQLFYYENIGTIDNPHFQLSDTNFLSLASRKVEFMSPFFHDLTGDGLLDIAFTWYENGGLDYELYFIPNTGSASGMNFNPASIQLYPFNGLNLFNGEFPYFYDVSGDGTDDLIIAQSNFGVVRYYRNDGSIQNPNFTLIDPNAGFIGTSLGNLQPSLAFEDMDRNGEVDMVWGDLLGRIKVYPNFVAKINSGDSVIPRLNVIENNLLSPNFPRNQKINQNLRIAIGDLNNDTLMDVVTGNKTGGIQIFYNNSTPITGLSQEQISQGQSLRIFPVPANDMVNISSASSGEIEVRDILGRLVATDRLLNARELFKLDISTFETGIYFVRLRGDNGKIYNGRIIRD
jgi:hypothetical protein